MPSKIKEAFDVFIHAPPTETSPSYEDIMNENTRLRQVWMLIIELRKATVVEDAAPRESN